MKTKTIIKLLSIAVVFCGSVTVTLSQTSDGARLELTSRLDSVICVDKSLKQLESDPSAPGYAVLHAQLQSSLSGVMRSVMPVLVERLGSRPDWSLTMKLLVLSYGAENSSVDLVSRSLGQILLNKPAFLSGAIRQIPRQQRPLVIQRLKAGWALVAAGLAANDTRRVAAQSALDGLTKLI